MRESLGKMNKLIEEAKQKANGTQPVYYQDREATLCVIVMGRRIYWGTAQCNGRDKFNPELGREIAYRRALKKIALTNAG